MGSKKLDQTKRPQVWFAENVCFLRVTKLSVHVHLRARCRCFELAKYLEEEATLSGGKGCAMAKC